MVLTKQSIAEILLAAQVAIDNAISDREIRNMLLPFGYNDVKLNTGKALLDRANELQQKQQKEYGDQFKATAIVNEAREKADVEYMRFVKVARVAMKSDYGFYKQLALNGDRKRSLSGWIAQAKQFYLNALSDDAVLAKMAAYGMTKEKMEAGKLLLEGVEYANAEQQKEVGEAQQATLERDNAVDNLCEWLSEFVAIARIALEEKPQYLEKLGILERSED